MAYRIVEQIRENGSKQYVVETNRRFCGWFKSKWHVATAYLESWYDADIIPYPAIFNTLKEAQIFCGIDTNPIIKKEIIETYI